MDRDEIKKILEDQEQLFLIDGDFDMLEKPLWGLARKCHDWRNHVPQFVIDRWDRLNEMGRLCVFVMAEHEAQNEHWD